MNLTTPTTAAQLAAEHCRDPHEVACELADACRAGLIGGREFNGKIIYHPIPTERTMNAIEELRALPRVSIQKTYVSGGNATCVADGFVQSSDAEAIVTRQQAEIDDLRRQLSDITSERDELRQQLSAQAPMVAIAEELRELLQGTAIRNTGSEGVDLTVIDGKSIASTFIKLRDMKGGA